jgi:hypothetical protein
MKLLINTLWRAEFDRTLLVWNQPHALPSLSDRWHR